jgi:hypothetical protein
VMDPETNRSTFELLRSEGIEPNGQTSAVEFET